MNLVERFRRRLTHKKKKRKEDRKYIYDNKGGYAILKRVDGEMQYFGWYTDIEVAKGVRDELIANNWHKDTSKNKYTHIYEIKSSGRWRVMRNVNSKTVHFGVYDTLEKAVEARDRIDRYGWVVDPDRYIEYLNDTFVVSRYFPDTGREYYGTFDDLNKARERVVELAKDNWGRD